MINLKKGFVPRKGNVYLLFQKESEEFYSEIDKKRIYLTIKVTTNYAGILCGKEG